MPTVAPMMEIKTGNITAFQQARSAPISGEKRPIARRLRRSIKIELWLSNPAKIKWPRPRKKGFGHGCFVVPFGSTQKRRCSLGSWDGVSTKQKQSRAAARMGSEFVEIEPSAPAMR